MKGPLILHPTCSVNLSCISIQQAKLHTKNETKEKLSFSAMTATSFSCSFTQLPRFNSYVKPILRSLSFQLSSSPIPFNAHFSSIRLRSSLSRPAETDSTTGGRSGALTPGPSVGGDVQKIDVNPPKGTRDFPPEDMRLRNWLFNHFKEVCVVLDSSYSLIAVSFLCLFQLDCCFFFWQFGLSLWGSGFPVVWIRRGWLSGAWVGGTVH